LPGEHGVHGIKLLIGLMACRRWRDNTDLLIDNSSVFRTDSLEHILPTSYHTTRPRSTPFIVRETSAGRYFNALADADDITTVLPHPIMTDHYRDEKRRRREETDITERPPFSPSPRTPDSQQVMEDMQWDDTVSMIMQERQERGQSINGRPSIMEDQAQVSMAHESTASTRSRGQKNRDRLKRRKAERDEAEREQTCGHQRQSQQALPSQPSRSEGADEYMEHETRSRAHSRSLSESFTDYETTCRSRSRSRPRLIPRARS